MAVKWKSTSFKGVRCYEHASRKYGVRKDLYFSIRYQKDGARHEEGLGWSSEGWTAEKAALQLAELRNASRLGEGPKRIREKREIDQEHQEKKAKEKAREKAENVTFQKYFTDTYLPVAGTHKGKTTTTKEEGHVRLWIGPVIGGKPFKDITAFDLERVKKNILDAGKSPRTLQHVMATFRQVWNKARLHGLADGDSPTRSVKLPRFDNIRDRFLTRDEADLLLDTLRKRCIDTCRMVALALYAGLRRSEIFKLHWRGVDFRNGTIRIVDAKAGESQTAVMNESTRAILEEMKAGAPSDLVFSKDGKPYTEIPSVFDDVVNELGFNEHVEDRRQKVVFHSLRHTYASWLVMAGVSLYQVQKLMRHKTVTMTARYAHLAPDTLKDAARIIDTGTATGGEPTAKAEGE